MSEHSTSEKGMDIKDLISSQKLTLERIKKMKINYGKDSLDRKTKAYLELRMDLLKEKWVAFKETHRMIMSEYVSENNKLDYFKNDVFGEVEDLYVELLSSMQQYKTITYGVVLPDPAQVNPNNAGQKPKLPTISLPKFSGEYTNWTSFYDLFLTLIHNNEEIPNVQKLYYLKTHLTDEPEQLLRHVMITEANYQTAWETLVARYENKRVLVNTQLKILLSQRTLTVEGPEGIRNLLDTTSECLKALQNLEIEIKSWDPIIIFLTTQKLPAETHQMWEHSISSIKELPTFDCLKEFLEARFRTLEVVGTLHSKDNDKPLRTKASSQMAKSLHSQTYDNTCYHCQERHNMRHCAAYLKLDVSKRISIAKEKGLCLNCLTKGHQSQRCYSKVKCKFCGQRHHQLLHYKRNSDFQAKRKETASCSNSKARHNTSEDENSTTTLHSNLATRVLLATALIKVKSRNVNYTLRALLDQGSQTSFITESAVQLLNLKKVKIDATIKGIGSHSKQACYNKVDLNINSLKGEECIDAEAMVLKTITELIPAERIMVEKWPHIKGLTLADPGYLLPGKIDVLLGADVYSQILKEGLKIGPPNTPVAQNTMFGWIISGKTANNQDQGNQNNVLVNCHNIIEIDSLLKRFWEIEEMHDHEERTDEEIECERMFKTTHKRDKTGRYIVNLPFKENIENPVIGKSRHIAAARFAQTEKGFNNNETLKESHAKCITEYLQLDHLQMAERTEKQCRRYGNGKAVYSCYYLPHHPVTKEESSTTKLRVVFNASQKTDSNVSLNDMLMTGPTIQDDLKAIILRWRWFKYAYSADIEKMYRQVIVNKKQQEYQRILWRYSPKEEIREFCLTRVTFGFTSAAFLAIRSLQQLAYDEGDEYPIVKDILRNDFYVDNVLYGADTVQQAIEQRHQLISLLAKGGFPLKKWAANHEDILEGLDDDYKEIPGEKDLGSTLEIKTLGILWNIKGDHFSYNFDLRTPKLVTTKRIAASIIAKIFDALGWCAPVTVVGKILLQSLWLLEVTWDEVLPEELYARFQQYQEALKEINIIQIPRWIGTNTETEFELHGFCDASNKAYAAAIYIRLLGKNKNQRVHLLAAATKVAPIKTITLPRLELCGALLLSKLCKYYSAALKAKATATYAWTDSKIVLSWLNGYPNKWKCFVANRVTEIKKLMLGASWRHVPSKDNPADCASRGIQIKEFLHHELWWSGPAWLSQEQQSWPKSEFYATEEEIKPTRTLNIQVTQPPEFMLRYSQLNKLIRVTAYMFRFINKCKGKRKLLTRWLSPVELEEALAWLIKKQQEFNFPEEIKRLKQNKSINRSSRLIKLFPFFDKSGILRVGGRLQQSEISYEAMHPMILDNKCFLTDLIIRHTHTELMHGGPQLSLNTLRQRYWIIGARNKVRSIINKCVTCVKQKGMRCQQLMGSLPKARITESRPFSHTGIDYCGPVSLRLSKGRGTKSQKGYIAIFICLAVKAIHIELVSDLSTPSFVGALKRFTSRRGLPSDIYSDCGTNFVGASRVMEKDLIKCIKTHQEVLAEELANDKVTWHFNPPSAPNFGGLWEAGVKSTKSHLKRLLQNRLLTFEEMTTLLAQIEATLNSRPIIPSTNDIEDMIALTPGHFLIGAPMKVLPEPSLLQTKERYLTRWHFVQQLSQHFWKRWHQEYLTHLQQRTKWNQVKANIEEGELVLIKEQNLPPNTWLLGRVIKAYPGVDKLNRVFDIKTKTGIIKRPITKICKLPATQQ